MSDVSLGKLKLEADTSGIKEMTKQLVDLKDGLPSTSALVDKFVKSLGEIPAPVTLSIGAIAGLTLVVSEMVMKTIEANEQLGMLAAKAMVPVEQFGDMSTAMKRSGVDADTFSSMLNNLNKAISAAEVPTSKQADAFHRLGISQEEIKKGDTADIFAKVSAALSGYADDANKAAIMTELFKKNGASANEGIKSYAENLEKVAQATADYGQKATDVDVKNAQGFKKTLADIADMFDRFEEKITRLAIPALKQFGEIVLESGKEGGFLREIFDGLSVAIKGVVIVLLPVIDSLIVLDGAAKAVGVTIAWLADALSHPFDQAKLKAGFDMYKQSLNDIATETGSTITKMNTLATSIMKTSGEAEKGAEAAKKHSIGSLSAGEEAKKFAGILDELQAKLNAQDLLYIASGKNLQAYRDAQADAATMVERAKLAHEGLTGKLLEEAIATYGATEAEKELTAENLRGFEADTKIAKSLGDIKIAQDHQMDSMKMSNTELKQKLELEKIQLQLEQEIAKDPGQADKYRAGAAAETQAIKDGDAATKSWQQSADGFTSGFSKGIRQNVEDVNNLNTTGLEVAGKLTQGMTDSLVAMMQTGKISFASLTQSMVGYFEQLVAKQMMAVVEEEILVDWKVISKALGFADGGAFSGGSQVTAFADGGVVSQPTVFNMGLMGEAGPEAIMPLQRDASGSLGVKVNGGGGNGGGTVHYNPVQITVHSSQSPEDVAKQVKKSFTQAQMISKKTIQDQTRTGGMLSSGGGAFSRG